MYLHIDTFWRHVSSTTAPALEGLHLDTQRRLPPPHAVPQCCPRPSAAPSHASADVVWRGGHPFDPSCPRCAGPLVSVVHSWLAARPRPLPARLLKSWSFSCLCWKARSQKQDQRGCTGSIKACALLTWGSLFWPSKSSRAGTIAFRTSSTTHSSSPSLRLLCLAPEYHCCCACPRHCAPACCRCCVRTCLPACLPAVRCVPACSLRCACPYLPAIMTVEAWVHGSLSSTYQIATVTRRVHVAPHSPSCVTSVHICLNTHTPASAARDCCRGCTCMKLQANSAFVYICHADLAKSRHLCWVLVSAPVRHLLWASRTRVRNLLSSALPAASHLPAP